MGIRARRADNHSRSDFSHLSRSKRHLHRGLRPCYSGTNSRDSGARRVSAGAHHLGRGCAMLPARCVRLSAVDLRVQTALRFPARIGGNGAASGDTDTCRNGAGKPYPNGGAVPTASRGLFPRNFPHWRHRCRSDDRRHGDLGRRQIRYCRISRCLCRRLHSRCTLSGNSRLSWPDSRSVAAGVAEMETRRGISRGALTVDRVTALSCPDLHAAVVERPAVVGWRRLLRAIALRLRGRDLRGTRLIDRAAIVSSSAVLRRGRCLRRY